MRVVRWKNAATGVQSHNITETGVYFPVGKEDGSFIGRYVMASAGQSASVEIVRDSNGTRVGVLGVSVSGVTEIVSQYKRSLAYGIIVTAISGTLTATLDDQIVRTIWPDNLGRFPAQADLDAYTYMGTGLDGCTAMVAGISKTFQGTGVGWSSAKLLDQYIAHECHMGTIGTMSSPGYDGRTYQLVRTAEGHFVGLRVIIRNNEAALYVLGGCAVAASATAVAGNVAPTGAWAQVTFGGSATPTIPARLGVNRPSITVSDVVYLSSIVRTDGRDQPYIFLRSFNATGPKSGFVGSTAGLGPRANWGSATALNRGRIKWSASAVGNFASSNQAGMSDDSGTYDASAIEIQPIYTGKILSVMGIGDSIMSGDGASINGSGYGFRACADISTITRPVVWSNYGFSNMTTSNFAARLTDALASGIAPQVLVIPSFSPNDGSPDQALIDTCKANLMRMLDLCRQYKIVPIVVTPMPRSYGATPEGFRQSLCTYVRGLASQQIILDGDALLATTPGGSTQDPSLCNDDIHPNDAGNDALSNGRNGSAGLKTILQDIAKAYF